MLATALTRDGSSTAKYKYKYKYRYHIIQYKFKYANLNLKKCILIDYSKKTIKPNCAIKMH